MDNSRLSHVLQWQAKNQPLLDDKTEEERVISAESHRVRAKVRRATDPEFRLLCNLRGRTRYALFGKGKSKKTKELLGCTMAELRTHLEKLFKPGMTWENYGEWEIDHICPCALFDLLDPAQQTICFHYTNLQPLWHRENLDKRDKYNGLRFG